MNGNVRPRKVDGDVRPDKMDGNVRSEKNGWECETGKS
jgi:hypothetical protein